MGAAFDNAYAITVLALAIAMGAATAYAVAQALLNNHRDTTRKD